MPKAILFDLDNTLIWDERSNQEAFEATCRYASLRASIDPGQLESGVRDESLSLFRSLDTFPYANAIEVTHLEALWARFDQGDHPMLRRLEQLAPSYRKQAWTRGLLRAGVNDEGLGGELAELFIQERRNRPIVYEDTFQALDQLKGDYSLLLLTNGAPDLQQEKVDGIPGLAGYFPHIVISGYLGEGKPSESIFNHCMRLLDAGPSECVMVGDNLYTDILGANRSGISSIWLNRTGRERERDNGIVPTYEAAGLLEIPLILRNAPLL